MSRSTRVWILVSGVTALAVAIGLVLFEPSPPRRIVLATGQPGGAYDTFGHDYQQRLARRGLAVEIVRTGGSIDNLGLLVSGKADAAFVQGGTGALVPDPHGVLRGLAAIYFEPLWVFYRAPSALDSLAQFQGMKVSIGPAGSGTAAVLRILFERLGVDPASPQIVQLPAAEARRRLVEGDLDAACVLASYRDPVVTALLHDKGVRLLGFHREMAYTRAFRYLSPVKLGEGLLDLRANIPPRDLTLLAPAALLAARADLHPRVVEQILKVAQTVHFSGSLIDPPQRFPTLDFLDLPAHETAETYLTSGESFLSRLLPYWALRRTLQLKVIALPILVVMLPLLRFLPLLYRDRGQRLLTRYYAALRDAETRIAVAHAPDDLRHAIADLERLRHEMEALSGRLAVHHQRHVYDCRLHLALVQGEARDRLQKMQGGGA